MSVKSSGIPNQNKRVRIYVGNLNPQISKYDLKYLFQKYGKILDIKYKRSVASIVFGDSEDASQAITDLNGTLVKGTRIIVSKSYIKPIENNKLSNEENDIIKNWKTRDVVKWLNDIGLSQYGEKFFQHEIDGNALLRLSVEDLKELGITKIGHRKWFEACKDRVRNRKRTRDESLLDESPDRLTKKQKLCNNSSIMNDDSKNMESDSSDVEIIEVPKKPPIVIEVSDDD